jgi:alanine-synthesizing transaminase
LLEVIEIARQHNLIIFADEIYDKILYDDISHTSVCTLCDDVMVVTFNGLSKAYRACGFRQGWMVITGPKGRAKGYIEGLEMLASMRLCQRAHAARHPDRPWGLPEHQRADPAGGPASPAGQGLEL